MELRLIEPRDLERVLVLLARGHQQLVLAGQFDAGVVGKVADVSDVLHDLRRPFVQRLADARDQVVQEKGAQVADVLKAINGRTAGIERQRAPGSGCNLLLLSRSRVRQAKHLFTLWSPAPSAAD